MRFAIIAIALFLSIAPLRATEKRAPAPATRRATIAFVLKKVEADARHDLQSVLSEVIEETASLFDETDVLDQLTGDYVLSDIELVHRKSSHKLELTAHFNRVAEVLIGEIVCTPACGSEEVQSLVYSLLDRTLFDPAHGFYLPMRIRHCGAVPLRLTTLQAVIEQRNGVVPQRRIAHTVALEPKLEQWLLIGPRLKIADYRPGPKGMTAVLELDEQSSGADSFRDTDCVGKPRRKLAVMPLMSLFSTGVVNTSVKRGTQ